MPLAFAEPTASAIPVDVVTAENADAVLAALPTDAQNWANLQGFTGALGQGLWLPDARVGISRALLG